ncbi:MAG: PAS domain-containing sensor histidine kinase [Methanocella sp.]
MPGPDPYPPSRDELYRLIVEEAGQGIFVLNADDDIVFLNEILAGMLGRPGEEIIGHKLYDFTDAEDTVIVKTALQRRHSGIGGEYAFRLKTKDGAYRWVLATAKPLMDKDGRYISSFELLLDISPIKEIEAALRKEITKSELYADLIGHDMYNQLQIALGQLEIINEKIGEADRPLLGRAIETLHNCTRLVDRIKDISDIKTDVGQSIMIDVGQALSDAKKEFLDIAGMDIKINYTPVTGCKVMANRLLKNLFSSLIGQTIKRSPRPTEIWMGLDETRMEGKDYCRVTIEDNGPGMSRAEMKYLFEQFGLEGEKAKGIGFSFYFIKLLIEDFEGMIIVEDRVSGDYTKGSRFIVMLPRVET